MASSVVTQIIEDGPRYAIIKCSFVFNTTDLAATVIADPATLFIDPVGSPVTNRLNLKELVLSVQSPIAVQLQWVATTPVDLFTCFDTNRLCFEDGPGIPNNAGVGVTGQVQALSFGTPGTGTYVGAVWMKYVKTN
jgi:hypothetical protein